MNRLYWIWSLEHRYWWKPNRQGYTHDLALAGKYEAEEAFNICKKTLKKPKDKVKEMMFRVQEVKEVKEDISGKTVTVFHDLKKYMKGRR